MRAIRITTAIALTLMTALAYGESLPDPTQPMDYIVRAPAASGGPAAPSGPVLQSTLVSPSRKSAVISGKQVKVGDKFDGAVITDITPYEVRMNRDGRETNLRLLPKLTKAKGSVE